MARFLTESDPGFDESASGGFTGGTYFSPDSSGGNAPIDIGTGGPGSYQGGLEKPKAVQDIPDNPEQPPQIPRIPQPPPSVWDTGGTASPSDAVTMFYNQLLGRAPENQDVI